MLIPLSKIKIDERQRKDYGDLSDLTTSFTQFGQLEPVIVEDLGADQYGLRAGGRRLAAAAILGWTELEAVVRGAMDALLRQQIELEENIRRKDLEWQEEIAAVETIHKLKMEQDKTWTAEKTAELIGKSRRSVFNALELNKAIQTNPALANSDSQFTAAKKLKQLKEMDNRRTAVEARKIAVAHDLLPVLEAQAILGSCLDVLPRWKDESFDLVLTDPPYGVDYQDITTGDRTTFDDSAELVHPIVQQCCKELYRVLRNDRWAVVFWPTIFLEIGKQFLVDAGFVVAKKPLIWYKPNKVSGGTEDRFRQINSQYETILLARKGDPRLHKVPRGDVFVCDTVGQERRHPTQKPVELLSTFIDMLTVPGEQVLDPFAGSCATGVAAILMERHAICIELKDEYHAGGKVWMDEALVGYQVKSIEAVGKTAVGAE